MKNTKIMIIMIVIVLVSGCTGYGVYDPSDETIKIGAILIMSGVGAQAGEHSANGINLAVSEINSNGGLLGKQIEIVYENNPDNTPATAITALHKLNSEGIDLIIGPNWVTSSLAVAPIACEKKILLVSPTAGVPEFSGECDYIFDLWANDNLLSIDMAKHLYNNGYRNIAIIGSQDSWENSQAQILRDNFVNLGGEIASFQITEAYETDFRAEVLKIKDSGADAVVFTNYGTSHLTARQMQELDIPIPKFSILLDSNHLKNAHGALDGTIVVNSFTPTDDFTQKYSETYGEIDVGADTGYDAMMFIADAIKSTGSVDASIVQEYLNKIDVYDGASGILEFNGQAGLSKEPLYQIVKEGKLVALE